MKPRVSIAMIVRDEAEMLPGFLEASAGLWDELIAIDTGSSDATRELLRAAGARVTDVPWRDDFSAARNASLSHVTGEWVLVLDADERASPEFVREFRAATLDESLGALWVRMCNPLPYGHRREGSLLRAFRFDPTIHFTYAIHEDPSASVEAMLVRTGRRHARLAAPIEHLGYVRERAAAKRKKERDLGLLERCIASDWRDFYSRMKLMELARYWKDSELWRSAARDTLDALVLAEPLALAKARFGGELVALAAEGLFRVESPVGLAFLDEWEPKLQPSAAFFHRRAQVHEAQGHLSLAQRDFERCLSLASSFGDHQLTAARPHLGLSRLAIAHGRLEEARAHALQALEHSPRDPEALTAVAALTRHLEGPAGLARWVASHEAQLPHCPERDWAVGEALYAFGQYPEAALLLRRAAGVPPGGPAALRLAQALLAARAFDASEALARQLLSDLPEAGLGLLVFDLVQGRDTALDLELSPASADGAMRHWVDALLATREAPLIDRFAANCRAIEGAFPWLPAHLRRRSA